MSSAFADRIRAQPEELEALAGRIGLVRSDLEVAAGFDAHDSGLRSAHIEVALDQFNADWSQRRGDLIGLLRDSEQVLRAAAEQFRRADRSLASAFDDGGDR